ncbi:MAG: signal peptide peptidase SppA [Deltaproteobacteria bacterium]|nr:signal peptide peptidase SppA [Deltaproteobacteria bacterium]MBW1861063.1 signal peptide peptidase SppA [Deltaproteobacteria bacterium]
MSGKKHPILMVLIILGITVLFLGTVMIIILKIFGPSSNLSFGDRIGVIPIEGAITDPEPIVTHLVNFRKNRRIKAIILRINSPGGGVGPAQEIYREVRKTIKTKKVITSMGGLAASGGYYIASATNKIVANPGTITGSISVIMEFIQIEDLLKKVGVGLEVLKSGEFKDIGSPHRKMSEREKELIKDLISDIQKQFVNAVARGRHLSVEKVQEIADGRIFSGAQAKELGLVDLLGNFQDAVDLAKKMTGIKGDVSLVYPKKAKSNLWDFIFNGVTKACYRAIMNHLNTDIEYRWEGLSSLYN